MPPHPPPPPTHPPTYHPLLGAVLAEIVSTLASLDVGVEQFHAESGECSSEGPGGVRAVVGRQEGGG